MKIILAVDIGSSSVKVCAYRIDDAGPTATNQVPLTTIAHSTKAVRAVHPQSGRIVPMDQIYGAAEECIDTVMSKCRVLLGEEFSVIAVGFSSFTMNLIGVDENGVPIGEEASMSYACNSAEVLEEVEHLKR